MAMLAEVRRKQKWTLNPRGKQWSEDSNKFGQKMLEKMGWSSGKGLGANEQGMTEHVKVNYKNNQSGIGFKDRNDQWTQHQADFNDFLSQLQEQNSNSEITAQVTKERNESLELKSKQSRARVHYHKFTRGKDVKKYSSKDLANIFGKKELGDATEPSKIGETFLEAVEEPNGSKDTTGGVLTVKGGNIDEYFRNKLPNFVKKKNLNARVERNGSDEEYQPHFGFGFNSVKEKDEDPSYKENKTAEGAAGSGSGFAFANEGLNLDYSEEGSKSKRTKVDFAYDNPCLNFEAGNKRIEKCTVPFSREGFVNPALNLTEPTNDGNNGAEFEVSRVEFGVDNNALDLSDEEGKKKRVTFNDKLEYSTDVVKRKKGKSKAKLDKFEVESNNKLKKKSKESAVVSDLASSSEVVGFVNQALDVEVISEEINDNEMNERKTKKAKRKKKNRRESNLETIVEAAEEGSSIYQSEIGEAVLLDEGSSRKGKKVGNISKTNSVLEVELEANTDSPDGGQHEEERRVKKRKKKSKRCAETETGEEIVILAEFETEVKPEKIKHESKDEEEEITVVEEITRSKSKNQRKKNEESSEDGSEERINNEPEVEASRSVEEKKKKMKKKSKSKSKEKNNVEISSPLEAEGQQLDRTNTGSAVKRKSSDIPDEALKSTKKCKVEDAENVEQNGDSSVISATSSSAKNKKGRTPKKILKSLFSKAPTLYFSGANINDIAGYGADFRDVTK